MKRIVTLIVLIVVFMPHLASAQYPNPNCPMTISGTVRTIGNARAVIFCTQ